jgi:hypothetical protein
MEPKVSISTKIEPMVLATFCPDGLTAKIRLSMIQGWRKHNVPHDLSIEGFPGQNGETVIGPFDKPSVDKMSSGYLVGGIGWYRKSFSLSETDKCKIA